MIIVQNVSFSYDTRIQNVAATLERAGYAVIVISPRYSGDPFRHRIGGIERWHYPFPDILDGAGRHVFEYLYSFLAIGLYSIVGLVAHGARIVHICSPPDILFPLGALYRALGRRLLVDVHDLSPELAVVRYGLDRDSIVVRLLTFAELVMLRLANETITTTKAQRDVLSDRSGRDRERKREHIHVVPNGVDLEAIPIAGADRVAEIRTVGYLGTMNPQDGIDILLRAIHHVRHSMRRDDIRFLLIGDGAAFASLQRLATDLRIEKVATFAGRLRPSEALRRLMSCAVCVQPDPKNEFTDTCCMVKTLEYMSLAKPVVAFGLRETLRCCGQAAVYANENSHVDLAKKVVELIDDPAMGRKLGLEGRRRLEEALTWRSSERELLKVYKRAAA